MPEVPDVCLPGLLHCSHASPRSGQTPRTLGQELAAWCQTEGGWDLEVVERASGQRSFNFQPRQWVVERSFSWISREPSLEQGLRAASVQTSETLIQLAMIRLLLARLARHLRTSSQTPH